MKVRHNKPVTQEDLEELRQKIRELEDQLRKYNPIKFPRPYDPYLPPPYDPWIPSPWRPLPRVNITSESNNPLDVYSEDNNPYDLAGMARKKRA